MDLYLDVIFFDKMQVIKDTSKPKASFWNTTARKINLEFMKNPTNSLLLRKYKKSRLEYI